ncbi:MAG TPA: Rnase Y domain-containing protein, partial [Patescibacteria group bacterium]|nr:Rnase Y domain-containing protein [Patescibacteria group bacterium]
MSPTEILFVIIALLAGGGLGYVVRKMIAQRLQADIEQKASRVLSDAQNKAREELLSAKDKAMGVIENAKREERQIRNDLNSVQRRLEKREEMFDQKLLEIEDKKTKLEDKNKQIEDIKTKIQAVHDEQVVKLEKVAGLSREEAKNVLLQSIEEDVKEEGARRLQELEKVSTTEVENKARAVLSTAIMRCAAPHTAETTTTIVTLPSDDMKGRIIGKEGRNIRAIEQLTGVEIVIDETP